MTLKPPKKSLKKRFLLQHVSIILALLISIIAVVAILLEMILTAELNKDLMENTEHAMNKLQERISYLFENADNFGKNPILIGSIIDHQRRLDYLPKLIDHFAKKDIHSVTLLRFDKGVIYSTLDIPPDYSKTRYLTIALTLREPRFYVSDNKNLVYIVPVYLYQIMQGILVIEYDLVDIFNGTLPKGDFFYRLYADNVKITEKNFHAGSSYVR
ncbi:MAG: hypothetical protein HQL03_15885 [Nitrospirae bacterium]|nr:hypothetical protein [Nitrospirota bacterium]